jgi:ribonuclease D
VDRVVTTAEGVAEVARAARANGRCAIDTEFFWERTYAPQLCFVQVAVQGEVTLIDPLAGAPLDDIAGLIGDPAVEILMHAPAADILAFGLHYGTRPSRLRDTQVVAGFVGLTASASLERLLNDALKVSPDHHESFSDWKRRPLSASQLVYAGDDVRWLEALWDELHARLEQAGRLEWALAEVARRYPDDGDPTPDPREAWRKVQRRGRLSPRQLAVLRELAAWREQEARRRDLPSSWVVKDQTLVEIARVGPTSGDALGRIRGAAGGLKPRDVEAILAAVAAAKDAEPIRLESPNPPAIQRRADAAAGLAGTLLKVRCTDAGIAPELVATRNELERFMEAVVLGDLDGHPLGLDWRRALVGDELIALVEGRVSLALRDRPPYIAVQALDEHA